MDSPLINKLNISEVHALAFRTHQQTAASLEALAKILLTLHKEALRLCAERRELISNAEGRPQNQEGIAGSELPPTVSKVSLEGNSSGRKAKPEGKAFEITSYQSRYIALEIIYIGWAYNGSTYQAGNPNTVEGKLIEALKLSRLVPADASLEEMKFSRCGRTDSGVSARGQVVALRVRSKAREGQARLDSESELDYPRVLNRNLPQDIQVIGWSDVLPTFDARFSTEYREYRYFIPTRGELKLSAMQRAASSFIGVHDYRNFCKVDAEHVQHFVRHILDFRIEPMPQCQFGGVQIFQVHIRGSAFLWHQVRCMVAVLLMVGKKQEDPKIVDELLDVDDWGCKPQYKMADEDPLLFYSCHFKDLEFTLSSFSAQRTYATLEESYYKHLAKAALLHTVLERIAVLQGPASCDRAMESLNDAKHIPLARRGREPSLEYKFAKFGKTLRKPALLVGKRPVLANEI